MRTIKQFFNLKAAYRSDFKSFLRSIVALLLVVMLVFCSTYAWIEGAKNAEAKGEECTVIAGSGVKFIGPDATNPTSVSLPNKTTLSDCSSVDGRNIFIPTTGSIRKSSETTSTSNLKFRNAVEEDKNNKFLTAEFSIKSLENKSDDTSKTTPIYIDSSSSFTCASGSSLPFRVSLNFNDGSDPVVLCPGLSKPNETRGFEPVNAIDESTGAGTDTSAIAYPMSYYFYQQTPVYSLPYGETRKVTVTLWLEGTDADCDVDNVSGKSIDMSLILTTEDTNMRTITFVDYTPKTWVQNDNAVMYVVDENTQANYAMKKSPDNKTYTARIPDSVTKVRFQRATNNATTPGTMSDFNSWSAGDTDDLSSSSTYYAIGRGNGGYTSAADQSKYSYDDKNYGYWVNDSCTGVIEVTFTDSGGKYASAANAYPYIYVFNSKLYGTDSDNHLVGKAWTGFHMDQISTNTYRFYIPAENGITINFNGGSSSNQVEFTVSGLDQNSNYSKSYSN